MSEEASPHTYHLNFSGSAGHLFGIFVRNVFLTLITFGVYYFWGKTRVRADRPEGDDRVFRVDPATRA